MHGSYPTVEREYRGNGKTADTVQGRNVWQRTRRSVNSPKHFRYCL
jgi:hypothetical protein